MKEKSDVLTNKNRVRMEYTVRVIGRLGLVGRTQKQQVLRYLQSLSRSKHGHMIVDLKNDS